MPAYSVPLGIIALFTLAPLSLAVQGEEERAYSDPYAGLAVPSGVMDGAVQVPPGEISLAPGTEGPGSVGSVPLAWEPVAEGEGLVDFVRHGEDIWMRGPTYKARASRSGFTYIPFLGSKVPRSYPVEFRLTRATVDGEALLLEAPAQTQWEGQRLALDRGPVEVIYDVRGREVEQLFALDLDGAVGDVELTLGFTSDLVPEPMGSGFRFVGPHGGMDYGAATVFDGEGRSAAIETVLKGSSLRLTVPAAFVARAKGQILIDPILSTYSVDETGGDQRQVDVAYDLSTDTFTFVYEDTFSGNDADIYRRTRTRSGVLVNGGLIFGDDQVWRNPAIANLNGDNLHLVVASVTNSGGNREVWGRTYAPASNSLSSDLLIGGSEGQGFDNLRPDVAGNARDQAGLRFLVVWERRISPTRRNVRLRAVEADGTLGTLYSLNDGDNRFQEEVSVSQSAGDPASVNVWNIVWREENLLTDTDYLRGAQLSTNVFLASPVADLDQLSPGRRMREVDVSDGIAQGGPGSAYVATYDDYGSSSNEATILVVRDNALASKQNLADIEHADPSGRQDARLGATHDRFVATYVDQSSTEVYATVLQLVGDSQLGVAERRAVLGSTLGANRGGAALAAVAAGGGTGAEVGIGWSFTESTSDYGASGVTFSAFTSPVAGYHFCYGRANSTGDYGFLTMFGAPSLTETKIVTASGLPPNQFAILLVGTIPVDIPMIGGSEGTLCLGGQFGRYNSQIASSGSGGTASFLMDPSAIPAPFGTDAALVGEQFFWQAWHRDVVNGGATSNLTNGVAVTFE